LGFREEEMQSAKALPLGARIVWLLVGGVHGEAFFGAGLKAIATDDALVWVEGPGFWFTGNG